VERLVRIGVAALLSMVVCATARSQATLPTLRQAIAQAGVSVEGADLPNLDKAITSGAELNDEAEFVITYFVAEDSGNLDAPLFVHRYDKRQQTWTSVKLPEAPAQAQDMNVPCMGSVLAIHRFQGFYLLDTHLNPSAGCVLILTKELKWKTSLYGWFLGGLGKDHVIYHRSEIHFAAAHPMELGMYDLASDRDFALFPPKPDPPIRKDLAKRIGEFFAAHADWCNINNHPCDATWFDSSLSGEVAVSAEQDALAFVVSYETEVDHKGGNLPEGPKAVLYVYRHVSDGSRRQIRESLLQEAEQKVGVSRLQDFLKPDRLEKLFAP